MSYLTMLFLIGLITGIALGVCIVDIVRQIREGKNNASKD